ncbi:MAG: response regulator [Dehalococcoidia bacterium]
MTADTNARTVTVGLVENHEITRDGLVARLHLAGYSVVSQVGSVEALAEHYPLPDVVVCDLHLDGRSGAVAIRYLTDLGALVLATTGVATAEEVLDAIAAGARGFVAKTAPSGAFARAVGALAAGSYFVSPELAGFLLDDRRRRPLTQGEISHAAVEALRGFAQGDTAAEVAAALGLAQEGLGGLLGQVWGAAQRRRGRYAPSPQERRVMALAVRGMPHKQIAAQLGIGPARVAELLEHVRDKYVTLYPEDQGIAPLAAAIGGRRGWA